MRQYDKPGTTLSLAEMSNDDLYTDPFRRQLREELVLLQDKLEEHLASQRFYLSAIQSITSDDNCSESSSWHFGAFLTGQWLQSTGDEVLEHLMELQQRLRKGKL